MEYGGNAFVMPKQDTQFKKGQPRPKGAGRKKGQANRMTVAVKEAIMNAFEEVGGEKYLVNVAHNDPKTFCTLLGKILPAEIKAEMELAGEVHIHVNTGMTNRPPVGIHNSKIIEHESSSQRH